MSKKNTQQKTLVFVMVCVGFLGSSIFAGINIFTARQKNQDFSQLDAEEKFSRLPEYLLKDLKLLKNKDALVRSTTARALGDLQSKEAIPELIVLLKESPFSDDEFRIILDNTVSDRYKVRSIVHSECHSASEALAKLGAVPQLILSFKKSEYFIFRKKSCFAKALQEWKEKTTPQSTKLLKPLVDTTINGETSSQKVIPILTELLNNPDNLSQYSAIDGLVALDGLNESQLRKVMLKVINELEVIDVLSDSNEKAFAKSLAIDISAKMYLKYNQKFKESAIRGLSISQSRQIRDRQWMLTGSASVISLCLLLLTFFSLQQLQRIGWRGHLICYFPDEVVSELIAFRRELTETNKSPLSIETRLLYVVFTLIWAFYIQINIDNLWLPSKDQRRR